MPALLGLMTFVRVVEAGSFAEAGRRAGTTSSAISKAITRFEQRHSVRLLHRTTHSLSLTDEGERLFEGARQLLREAEKLGASLSEGTGKTARGRVKVSIPGSLARTCLLPFLPAFHAQYPEITLDLSFEDALVDLGAEGVDIAVRAGEIEGQPGLIATELLSYPYVLCASPSYLRDFGIPINPGELAGHKHIGFRNRGTGKILSWQFAEQRNGSGQQRVVPAPDIVVDDGAAAWDLMRNGMGITWGPAWLGLSDLSTGRVVELLRDWRVPPFRLFAIRLSRRQTPARTRVVLDFLKSTAARWAYDDGL
ncbi:LysR family transcriptional regulator [Burkholderia plantarii]|uniref:LysR family transcriptional regulator n=1 Tax=Burkholderia plantarii TaxID=41899 RepID=UPI0018DBC4CB|nr:LysR family transcriptional regulator [Burkholderia plantarii]MBI0329552.1 LysR family transcriptional regulator [Burkholderia plantarii]